MLAFKSSKDSTFLLFELFNVSFNFTKIEDIKLSLMFPSYSLFVLYISKVENSKNDEIITIILTFLFKIKMSLVNKINANIV